ncbi:MAG: CHAT domain-containing protein [Cyclobacteriaceae bacterium]|nr:CHAT domain-containing protein [Cyclobacteriaceae bacterium]
MDLPVIWFQPLAITTGSDMKKMLITFLVSSLFSLSLLAQDTTLETLDVLLLDANYTEVIRLTEGKSIGSNLASLQVNCKRAQALIRSGKLDEGRELLDQLSIAADKLTSDKDFASAILSSHKGMLYLNEGRNDLALEALQSAIDSFGQSGNSTSLEAAEAIATLGIVYNVTGKSQQAEEQLLKALSLRKEVLPESHELIAATYNDLGLVYTATDAEKALDYYDQSLAIYQQLHDETHPKIAIANTNLGVIYRELEFYGDAVNSLETALNIWEKVYPQAHPSRAFVLSNLGQTYVKMGDTKAGQGYFDRALKMYEESYGNKHPDIASTLNAIGNLELAQRKYDEAINYYQRALQANVKDFNSSNPAINPDGENFYNGNVLLYSLLFKAEALEAKYFGKTLKFADLLLSMESIKRCDELIERLRNQISSESDKLALGVIANEVYADGVRVAHTLAQNAWKKKPFRELTFYFAEKSKSAVLQDAISDSNAKSFAGIPPELLEEEKYLKALAAYCNQQLAQKPSPEEEQSLRDILFKVNRDYEVFVKGLEEKFPEYYNLKFNSASPSITEIQSKLDNKTAVLSYFMDEKNNRLYTFVISNNKYKIIDKEIPADFDKLITGLRNSLFYNEINTYVNTAATLSRSIIPPLPGGISHLVIIPTGRMGVIPFEALFSQSVKSANGYGQLPYLLNDYSISYEFSAGLILQKEGNTSASTAPASILLCAPVEFTSNSSLNTLPGTEEEVQKIAQLFSSRNLKSETLIKTQADEDHIKSSAMKDYKYLHFATHGIVDEQNPELSRIFLNQGINEDGNLYSGEIYNLELNADLVALSACETGLGKISKGEGVIGLSRALIYAGARNIIVSFWSVADASTSQLMREFYTELLANNNNDFSSALRASKLKMIKENTYAAPYYWAPFVIFGF